MKIQVNQKNKLFFTSDLHFFHRKILDYTNRKRLFSSVEEMNQGLVDIWNAKVSKNDTVIVAGDFSFGTKEETQEIFSKLNGFLYLAFGNHDSLSKLSGCNFKVTADVLEFNYNGKSFFVSHFAHKVWNKSHHGTIHLYGHSHGSMEDDIHSRSMDVGIDCHENFAPFSFDEVMDHMKNKIWKPIDHHKRSTM